MRTFRRLDDPTRYYGLSKWGWLAVALAGGALYGFVRLSPFDVRATLSVLLIACVLPAMAAFAASGQALGAGRYLAALASWAVGPKRYAHRPDDLPDGGIVLDGPPPDLAATNDVSAGWDDELIGAGHA
jgi:hypothetical protein